MGIKLYNSCGCSIIVTIADRRVIVMPRQSVSIEGYKDSKLVFAIRCENSSRFYKGKYFLSIETTYNCVNTNDEIPLVIMQDEKSVDSNVYFERVYIAPNNNSCMIEAYKIQDEAVMKRLHTKKRVIRFLLIDPLECFTGLVLLLIAVGMVLSHVIGWKFAAIYIPVSYLLLLTLNWCSEKLCVTIFKRGFHMDDEKNEFNKLFESDFILNFYSAEDGFAC